MPIQRRRTIEQKILNAAFVDREAYEEINKYTKEGDFIGPAEILFKYIGEYYSGDKDATSCDTEIIIKRIERKYPKLVENLTTVIKDFKEISVPNVLKEVLDFKKQVTGLKLSTALISEDKHKIRDLIEEYKELASGVMEESEKQEEPVRVYHNSTLEDLAESNSKENLFKVYPKSLNDKLGGGVVRGTSLAVFARPECVAGDATLKVIRGQRAYDANRSSREYSLSHLCNLFNRKPLDTWIKSVDNDDEVAYRRVKNVWSTGLKAVYRIRTLNSHIKVTPTHLVYTDRGWLEAQYIVKGDSIALHVNTSYIRTVPIARGQRKEYCTKLPNSPYPTRVISGHVYHRAFYHRVAYDADLNNLLVEEFLHQLKTNPDHDLEFSDRDMDIHHIDKDPTNDDPANLLLLTRSDHSKLHGANENFGQNSTQWDEVIGIEEYGHEECYDIEMETYPNFLVNNLVVHNCGKSLFAINMAAGFLSGGKKVMYIGNEDSDTAMRLRIIGRITGLQKMEILRDVDRALAMAREKGYENLVYVDAHPGTLSIIDGLTSKYQPDALVIDQSRNILIPGETGLVQVLEKVGAGIRSLGKKYNMVTVQVTQAGDSASDKLVLTMGDIDNSKTGFPAALDVLVGIGMNQEYEESNRRMLTLCKNKVSALHDSWSVTIDPSLSKVLN